MWQYTHSNGGDNVKFTKGRWINQGHINHGHRTDNAREINQAMMARFRKYFIEEFMETGDPTTINAFDWKFVGLMNPFDKELKNYDSNTGQLKQAEESSTELTRALKAVLTRQANSISAVNDKYQDAVVTPIDPKSQNSCCIIQIENKHGLPMYNTCKSYDNRVPLLTKWTTSFKTDHRGRYLYGKGNYRTLETSYYIILTDGTLGKDIVLTKNLKNSESFTEFL